MTIRICTWNISSVRLREPTVLVARHVRGWEAPSDHAPVFAEFEA